MVVDQWFYLSRWREGRQKKWAVIDIEKEIILKTSLTRPEATAYCLECKSKDNKTLVVNIEEKLYIKYNKNMRGNK